jgi:hypothetical protein
MRARERVYRISVFFSNWPIRDAPLVHSAGTQRNRAGLPLTAYRHLSLSGGAGAGSYAFYRVSGSAVSARGNVFNDTNSDEDVPIVEQDQQPSSQNPNKRGCISARHSLAKYGQKVRRIH